MPIAKKIMFQARLQKRLRELKIDSFEEYAAKLMNTVNGDDEFSLLADFISTNKTDFFREKTHFDFLQQSALPYFGNLISEFKLHQLNIWSAGCSSGQEAYSIAITIEEFFRSTKSRFGYFITATDISSRMLKTARTAIYPMEFINEVDQDLKRKYFLKSKDLNDPRVRVAKEIRQKVGFGNLNLMDDFYSLKDDFQVVFLRNTLIYFEPSVQLTVLKKVLDKMDAGGFLFIGHSESLVNSDLPIRPVAPSVYIKNS